MLLENKGFQLAAVSCRPESALGSASHGFRDCCELGRILPLLCAVGNLVTQTVADQPNTYQVGWGGIEAT